MKNKNTLTAIMNKSSTFALVLLGLLTFLVFSVVISVGVGTVSIPAGDIVNVILFKLFGVGDATLYNSSPISDVIWFIRLPRLILGVAVGIGLSVCGVIMQAIVKNPLADPYILGISSGASLGATLAIMLGVGTVLGGNFVGVMGFLGAFTISILVLVLSNVGGRTSSVKLLLAGMALSSVCSAFSSFIVYFANDKEGMLTVTYWLMGSLAGAKWESILFILPLIILSSIFFWSQHRILNLMLLGDDVAITLGTDLHKYRILYLLVSSLMIGFVVYSAGMIGFVGLVIPHIVRMLFGTDHKRLIPVSALLGAILLVWADVLCRKIIPGSEIPIGILISMLGAPCFVYLMAKKTYGFGGGK